MNTLFGSKRYRLVLCLALALVGVVFVASPSFMAGVLQMSVADFGKMSSQLVGVGFATAALIMYSLSTGKEDRKYVITGYAFASLFSGVILLFYTPYANLVLDLAIVCAFGIFGLCGWWFFKQSDRR